MSENPRLPIFERWSVRYDRSVQTDTGIFAGYDALLAEVVRAAGIGAGMRVLELGVGTGNLAQRFVALGCEVWGVDFSPAMLAIAREKVPQARLIQMDLIGEWPAAVQRRFDRIVATFVLHEFDLATKISLLQRLAADHLVEQGRIVVGDVAFATAAARHESGAESWDEDEFYWAADETLAGGGNNAANGYSATVAGGSSNTASGDYSFAAGRRAKANHSGTFVWADATNADFVSTADNQFLVRAAGGMGINTNAPGAALGVNGGNSVARIAVNSDSPNANAGLVLRLDGIGRWSIATVAADSDLTIFREGAGGGSRLFIDGGGANAGYVGIGNAAPQYPLHMASGAHVTVGGAWTNASSRQLKADFAAIDHTALLDALASLPIETWSYRAEDPAVRHLGPTAEDFYAAFGLGSDDGIGTVDADGVALATIQALYQLVLAQQAQLADQQQRIEALEARWTSPAPTTHTVRWTRNAF